MKLYLVRWKDSGKWISTNSEIGFEVWMNQEGAAEAMRDEASNSDCDESELEIVEFVEAKQKTPCQS